MQERKKQCHAIKIVGIMLIGMVVNYVGKFTAFHLQLPLWLDTIGTGITACLLGPVYGAIVGACNNILWGLGNATAYVYSVTGIAVGVIVDYSCRKGAFQNFFHAMSVGVIIAFTAAFLSIPLNLMFNQGLSGNVWGDALFDMLQSHGWNVFLACVLSEIFVDFPDKVVTILITYAVINALRLSVSKQTKSKKKTSTMLAIVLILFIASVYITPEVSFADNQEKTTVDQMNPATAYYTQTIYNSDNGLRSGEANAIVETQDGYVWIGTYAGLYRYDGRQFSLMNFDSVKNVNRLYVDKKGRLWIGTNDKGVSVYENGVITEVVDKKSGLPSNSIRCIGQDDQGNYYIGTSSTLCIISDHDGIQIEKIVPEVIYANNITVNSDGSTAIVTNSGNLILMKNLQVTGIYKSELDGVEYTSSIYDSKGNLYVATSSNTVYHWNFEKQSPDMSHTIQTGNLSYIHAMYETDEGTIWVCSDSGIGYFSAYHFIQVNSGVFRSSVDNMLKDYQGNLWFTSSRLGVLKLSKNSFTDIYAQCNLPEKVVNSVVLWEGYLYSGTDTGLQIINLMTKSQIENELTRMLENNRIRCLYVDSKNNLWISTSVGVGLVQVCPDGKITTYGTNDGTIGERFRSTLELSDGTIVEAENTGIDFIKDGRVIATLGEKDGLTNPQILSLVEKDDHTLYAGSDGNGIMIIQNQRVVGTITEDAGLPSGVILRMVKVDEGFVIVTSNSLCYMDQEEHITELKNFPYSNNYDVIEAGDGYLWVAGSAGIYIVGKEDLLTQKPLKYELLDSRKGLKTSLTANSWNCRKDRILYFSGNSGAYSIDMSNYMVYTGSYRMMVDYVDTDDNNFAITEDEVNIIPNEITRFIIRPELLNYTLNDPYISFYLEGVDEKEYLVQQSSLEDISYTNLPAGEYTFHMSILDNTGNQVIESHSYILKKQPKFWEHSWFYAYLIVVCVLGIIYVTWLFAVLHSNKIIEKQKQEIEIAKKQAEMGNETILAIAKTVDAKDVNTSEHSERVSQYSVMIAKRLGWSDNDCENLRKIALLHDIGKIGIPDSILNKPSRLNEEEYAVMKSHVVIGSRILKDFTIVKNLQDGVRYHHEKYDGSGYVEGLRGEQIPKDARIICIADAFDAMTSNRVYRKRMDMDYVIGEIKKGSGTQFDPQLVEIMLKLIAEGNIPIKKKEI